MLGIQAIASHWWILLIRGLVAILFGIVALVYPGITAIIFVFLFGGYAIVDGVLNLVTAIRFRHPDNQRWWWMIAEGVLGIGIGLVTFFYPGITAFSLGVLVCVWAITTGILEIAAAVQLRQTIPNEIIMIVLGALSIIVGIILAFEPLQALLVWVYVVAIYALIAGVAMIALSIRLRGVDTKIAT